MKKIISLVLMCSVVSSFMLILFFLFAPEDRINSAKESWRRIKKDNAQACLDDIRKSLKDPDSARLVSIEHKSGKSYYILKYKAKNSYGAYVQGEQGCDDTTGEVSVIYKLEKENEEMNDKSKNAKIIYPYIK